LKEVVAKNKDTSKNVERKGGLERERERERDRENKNNRNNMMAKGILVVWSSNISRRLVAVGSLPRHR
jgi:hypothetical protein